MCLAIPGKIESIKETEDKLFRTGIINFGGIKKEINLSMVPQAKINDYILAHAGIALNTIDEEEAKRVLSYYESNGGIKEELE